MKKHGKKCNLESDCYILQRNLIYNSTTACFRGYITSSDKGTWICFFYMCGCHGEFLLYICKEIK